MPITFIIRNITPKNNKCILKINRQYDKLLKFYKNNIVAFSLSNKLILTAVFSYINIGISLIWCY